MGRGPQRPALTGVGLGEPARSNTFGLSNLLANNSSKGSKELARNKGLVKGAKLVARSNTEGARSKTEGARSNTDGARAVLGPRLQ